jgi:hypothetical protein
MVRTPCGWQGRKHIMAHKRNLSLDSEMTGAATPLSHGTARPQRRLALAAVAGALALTLAAPALAGPLALGVRFGNHPATVRVVVDLTGPRIPLNRIIPGQSTASTTNFVVDVGGSQTRVTTANGLGVRVTITRDHTRLAIRTVSTAGRFKYAQWSSLGGPTRLVIDLWKAAPPSPAAAIQSASCLRLNAVSPSPGTVAVAGLLRNGVFENQFGVNVRNAHGAIIGHRTVVSQPGATWRVWVPYHVSTRQIGTLEAVAFGGNGNITCLVQRAVVLTPTP